MFLPPGILLPLVGPTAGESKPVRLTGASALERGEPSSNEAASIGSANAADSCGRPYHHPEKHGSAPGRTLERTLLTSATTPSIPISRLILVFKTRWLPRVSKPIIGDEEVIEKILKPL
jgi:hypothetical protein